MRHITIGLLALFLFLTPWSRAVAQRAIKNPHEKLSLSCETCHTAESFSEVQFNHTKTGFNLEGRHKSIECLSCHLITDFSTVDNQCLACHDDVHLGQLGVNCETCHTSRGWDAFDAQNIHSSTNFPLMGRHVLLDCASCHHGQLPSNFYGTPTTCVACHQMDYLEASQPNHVAGGFHTECMQCHTFSGWRPAMMPDHDPIFPIFSGTHRNQWSNCVQCHTDAGNYSAFTCLTCHEHAQPEMDGAHSGMTGYAYASPECYSCHPTGEKGNFANHDAQFFPIYSGKHNNQWASCVTCHVDPGAPSNFDCLGCHEHAQPEMDGAHVGMPGYAYASPDCYSCHPTGQKGEFVNHDAQFFPIYSGTHNNAWTACITCHVDPGAPSNFDCLGCHEHEQPAMNSAHVGMAGYAYSSPQCYQCHPTGQKGQFVNHDAQFFPIYSGKHSNEWANCSTCHVDPGSPSTFDCLGCHEHSQTRMDDKHLGEVNGYVYASTACYNCHPRGRKD